MQTGKELAEYIVEIVRGLTRPILLGMMVTVVSLKVYDGQASDIPGWFWGTMIPWFIWWSADRSLKHYSERKNKKIGD